MGAGDQTSIDELARCVDGFGHRAVLVSLFVSILLFLSICRRHLRSRHPNPIIHSSLFVVG